MHLHKEHMSNIAQVLKEADEENNEAMSAAIWFQMASVACLTGRKLQRGGSLPGKSANVQRNFEAAHYNYMVKYFWPGNLMRPGTNQRGPEQSESSFERRFRMPRSVFNVIFEKVVLHSAYMRKGLKPDALGRMGISPLVKVMCALRQIAYGIPSDLSEELFNVSETTARKCLVEFCTSVLNCFASLYLREPNISDLERIERQFARAGFPGCIGCLDCAGWSWKNCPVALQGIMKGKDGEPTLRMEAICDLDLWVWSFQFGLPGAFNDLNILEVSNHFNRVLAGEFPQVEPSYTLSGEVFNWYYYLTDGIFPAWKIFIKSVQEAGTARLTWYKARQEGARKCVERLFGVLFRRFKIMFIPSEIWSVAIMTSVAKAAIVMHNMIVESRRDSYLSDGVGGISASFDIAQDTTDLVIEPLDETALAFWFTRHVISDDIKLVGLNRKLTKALVDHLWDVKGNL